MNTFDNYSYVLLKDFATSLKIAEGNNNIQKLFSSANNISEINKNISKLKAFYNSTSQVTSDNSSSTYNYSSVLKEKNKNDKFLEFKISNLNKQYNLLVKENKDLSKQVEDLFKQNVDLNSKLSDSNSELTKLKIDSKLGMTMEEYKKIELKCQNLERDLAIQKVGMNTFKELYKTANKQLQNKIVLNEKHKDEMETYKLAIKDLQAESDAKVLIGKLYYSLLVSRWRSQKLFHNMMI